MESQILLYVPASCLPTIDNSLSITNHQSSVTSSLHLFMPYPQAPWTLQGYGLQTLHLLEIDRIRSTIPADLEIVSVFPGKTVGGVYLASYQSGSTLIYNELIVISGMVRHKDQVGGWVSHIYVDNPDSVAGGREIWSLPKELAEFTWQLDNQPSVRVTQGETLLCTCACNWQFPGWQQSLPFSSFSQRGSQLLCFNGKGKLKFNLAGLRLSIPAASPFADLGLGQPWFGFYCDSLDLIVNSPSEVAEPVRSKVNV